MPYEVVHQDVLVIGAGGAGLRAAVAAAETGVQVGVEREGVADVAAPS